MTQNFSTVITRVVMWVVAGIFAISLLIAGMLAAVVGGIWMLVTGRNPLQAVRNYANMARRMQGGGFAWGTGTSGAAQQAEAPASPSPANRSNSRFGTPRGEIQDVEIKDVR